MRYLQGPSSSDEILFQLQLALPQYTTSHINVPNFWQVPASVAIHPSYRLFLILHSFGQSNGDLENEERREAQPWAQVTPLFHLETRNQGYISDEVES